MAHDEIDPAEDPQDEPAFEIANEFARVLVRRRHTRNGVRLEIASPRTESRVLLDAVLLESLTWQSDDGLARFLKTPFQALDPPDRDEVGE
jgi:hypothetical protein